MNLILKYVFVISIGLNSGFKFRFKTRVMSFAKAQLAITHIANESDIGICFGMILSEICVTIKVKS